MTNYTELLTLTLLVVIFSAPFLLDRYKKTQKAEDPTEDSKRS